MTFTKIVSRVFLSDDMTDQGYWQLAYQWLYFILAAVNKAEEIAQYSQKYYSICRNTTASAEILQHLQKYYSICRSITASEDITADVVQMWKWSNFAAAQLQFTNHMRSNYKYETTLYLYTN